MTTNAKLKINPSKGLFAAVVSVEDPETGAARILNAPKILTSRSRGLRSNFFSELDPGKSYIVNFRVSGESQRRYVLGVVCDETDDNFDEMVKKIDATEDPDFGTDESEDEAAPEPTVKVDEAIKPNGVTAGIYFNNEQAQLFNVVNQMAHEHTVRVSAVGPSGYGKTDMGRAFAEATGRDLFYWNCASVRDPEEWFGYREASEGSTHFVKSGLMNAIEKGNAVIVLDEFNRVETWLHNSLFPLLDDRGETTVHGETFKVGPNVVFIMTLNLGFNFVGTFEMDTALANRVDCTYVVGPLPSRVEAKLVQGRHGLDADVSRKLVLVMSKLRAAVDNNELMVDVSTRTTLKMAKLMKFGMDVRAAATFSVINSVDQENTKPLMDAINSTI